MALTTKYIRTVRTRIDKVSMNVRCWFTYLEDVDGVKTNRKSYVEFDNYSDMGTYLDAFIGL